MLITPRTLSGFRDYLPAQMIVRERLMERARVVYRSYGFAPIDTPSLEYAEILLGKGGEESDRQLYRFRDNGDRDVAMRFDLTVPFARFAAQHIAKLGVPFKRYHLGVVWRGERQQRGRYREFMQCDFDTIGTTSNASDIETALVIHDLMLALGFERFELRINNRLVLNGLLEELGLADRAAPLLRALDKLPKADDPGEIAAEMVDKAGATSQQAERVLALASLRGAPSELLDRLRSDFGANDRASQGISQLAELFQVCAEAGLPPERLRLDLSIARGLDYYTGTIYETFLLDLPAIGSVCSGGRYDNLAGLYTKQALPGVGASLGLDRLLAAMEEIAPPSSAATPAPVLIVQFDAHYLGRYQRMARLLRAAGIGVEVYPEAKKIGQQFKYAEGKGHLIALIAGEEEFTRGAWKCKDLRARSETTLAEADVPAAVHKLLENSSL